LEGCFLTLITVTLKIVSLHSFYRNVGNDRCQNIILCVLVCASGLPIRDINMGNATGKNSFLMVIGQAHTGQWANHLGGRGGGGGAAKKVNPAWGGGGGANGKGIGRGG
jgi:hypothetical protein